MATRKKTGKKLLVFDFETTGLTLHARAPLRKQPHAIEFAGAIYDCTTRKLIREYSTLINPGVQVTEEITKITGITQEQVSAYGVPVFAEVEEDIRACFAECDISVAHNHPFDSAIMQFELDRNRVSVEEFPWCEVQICTVEWFKPLFGRRAKLTEVYERVMGKKLEQTHRALDDVNALAEVALKEKVWL